MAHLTKAEQETVITFTAEGEEAHIHTSMKRWVTKLKKNPAFVVEEEFTVGSTVCVNGRLPQKLVSVRNGKVSVAGDLACPTCGKTFASKQGHANHIKRGTCGTS